MAPFCFNTVVYAGVWWVHKCVIFNVSCATGSAQSNCQIGKIHNRVNVLHQFNVTSVAIIPMTVYLLHGFLEALLLTECIITKFTIHEFIFFARVEIRPTSLHFVLVLFPRDHQAIESSSYLSFFNSSDACSSAQPD